MDWTTYVGQTQTVSEISDFLMLHAQGAEFPPVCLLGPKGCGKSTLASLTAHSLGIKCIEMNADTMDKKAWNRVWRSYQGEMVFLDELQFVDKRIQIRLMDWITNGIHGIRLNVMFAAMERKNIIPALLDRLTVLEMESYSLDELQQITRLNLTRHNVKLSDVDVATLAYACRGNLRELDRLCWSAWKDQSLDREPTAFRALTSRGLTQDGWSKTQIRLLKYLQDHDLENIPVNVLAWAIQTTPQELSVIEAELRSAGLVEVGHTGRQITRQGFETLKQLGLV